MPARSVRRAHFQTMGYWLNEPAILDHGRIKVAMEDLGRSGYGIVRIMIRQTCFHHRSPEVIAAVAVAVDHGHRNGLLVALDCEPHELVSREIGREYPDAVGLRIYRGEGPLRGGLFQVDFQLPDRMGMTFDHVVAAVLDGKPMQIPLCSLVWETNMSHLGIIDQRQEYVDGKAFRPNRHVRLSGSLDGEEEGQLALYLAVLDRSLIDFASSDVRSWFRALVADYSHIPLDGIGWDEPAIGGDWRSYRYGRSFARRFRELNGYELSRKIHLLDAPGLNPDAVRVRLNYYQTLNEGLLEAQSDMFSVARSAFGEDILLGTHHTWQGEGGINDYRSGAVDYFRLNDIMDAGYTDCCWWDPRSVAYSYALGGSLGRLTQSKQAEVNTWHWKPTVRSTVWNARLMSLMRITWFNIWYGNDCDTAMYPAHYTWSSQVESMRRHRAWQRFLGDAMPIVDVAVLHDWKSVCGTNVPHVANLHKSFCINISYYAQECSLSFDFIDSRLLASSHVVGGCLVNALGRYRTLVLPGISVIDREAWSVVALFIRLGGRVIFAGPPPSVDACGDDLTEEFSSLFGIRPLHADAYDAWYRRTGAPLPLHRPDHFDLAMPIMVADADRAVKDAEGMVHGVRSDEGAVVWFSGYEASSAVVAELRRHEKSEVGCHSSSVMWRLFRTESRVFLLLVAREDQELSGIIEYAGWNLRLSGGESLCLVLEGDGSAWVHVEDATVRWSLTKMI